MVTEDENVYVRVQKDDQGDMHLWRIWVDDMGIMHETGEEMEKEGELLEVNFWKAHKEEHFMTASDQHEYYKEPDRVMGPVASTFPRDKGWKMGSEDFSLGGGTIKFLTKQQKKTRDKTPNCQKNWETRIGKMPWKKIWRLVSTFFTTHRERADLAETQAQGANGSK